MTNDEFHRIIMLRKIFVNENTKLPLKGESNCFDLLAQSTGERFFFDISRQGSFELSKCKLQNRTNPGRIPLVRIDIDSPPHLNPDGSKTTRNHIHIYSEEDGDTGRLSWAYSLEAFEGFSFNESFSFMECFYEFCKYCNIIAKGIQGVL